MRLTWEDRSEKPISKDSNGSAETRQTCAMSSPRITVLFPVKNGGKWITTCLDSIQNQTYRNFEILLIDDGSTDDTLEIVLARSESNLQIIHGPEKGLAAALALGVQLASGEFIARQDVDDFSHPKRFESQINYFDSHLNTVVCGTSALVIKPDGEVVQKLNMPVSNRAIRLRLFLNNAFIHTSVMFRRDAAKQVGGYFSPGSDPFPEDLDLWLRMATIGELHNLSSHLVSYQINPEGITGVNGQALRRVTSSILIENWDNLAKQKDYAPASVALIANFHGNRVDMDFRRLIQMKKLLIRERFSQGLVGFRHAWPLITYLKPLYWWARGIKDSS